MHVGFGDVDFGDGDSNDVGFVTGAIYPGGFHRNIWTVNIWIWSRWPWAHGKPLCDRAVIDNWQAGPAVAFATLAQDDIALPLPVQDLSLALALANEISIVWTVWSVWSINIDLAFSLALAVCIVWYSIDIDLALALALALVVCTVRTVWYISQKIRPCPSIHASLRRIINLDVVPHHHCHAEAAEAIWETGDAKCYG